MNKKTAKAIVVISGLLVTGVYSSKGLLDPPQVKIINFAPDDGPRLSLEWPSKVGVFYTVESTVDLSGSWDPIAEDLSDPNAPSSFRWDIPDEFVFDSRRFFRLVLTVE
jgi:hypothetical protein